MSDEIPPTQPPLDEGRVETVEIEQEVQSSYINYAMSVIVARALPDVRDGLKPVHRRIMWSMYREGMRPGSPYKKSARVVGDVTGKYHPHGPEAVYDTVARLAQDFTLRHPLVDGRGNFGTLDGDPPAAMRYCVAGDTLIRTADGATIRIDQLVPGADPNTTHEIEAKVQNRLGVPVVASRLFHCGDHPTLRLKTAEGFELVGTSNHPVLCLVDVLGVPMLLWRFLGEIEPGERVAIYRRPSEFHEVLDGSEEKEAFLIGAFLSEGWVSEARAGFNNTDLSFFRRVVDAYDAVVGGRRYLSDRQLASGKQIFELDIQFSEPLRLSPLAPMVGLRSGQKHFPQTIWNRGPQFKRILLQALWEGDGSCSDLGRNSIQLSYSTQSERLAREVQCLMTEFGVVGKLVSYASGEWKVVITNRRDARRFQSRIGFAGAKQAKLTRLLSRIPTSSRSLSRDHIPFLAEFIRLNSGSDYRARDWLKRHNIDRYERWERDREAIVGKVASQETRQVAEELVEQGFYYARVKAVEEAGVRPVFSMRVESDCHSFITNGFVSHNTEVRLAAVAGEMLRDIDEETVDMVPNYDGEEIEPVVMPSRFPNLLVNGSTGIAVGMATNVPPHNLGEVIDAAVAVIDDPEINPSDLTKIVKGPDFPTGGAILGRVGVKDAYTTGRGTVRVRALCEIEETRSGRQRIIVTELPYLVSGDRVLEKIAELATSKKVQGISDLRNESSRAGVRLVIELRKDAIPQVVLNNLYKYTQLQDSFGMNMLALVEGIPKTLSLKEIISHYVDHQVEVVTRRTRFRLRKAEERMHILDGLLIALKNLDAVIKLIRAAKSADDARGELMKRFKLSEVQATAILDMQLRRLAALERQKIIDEAAELAKTIKELKSVLASPARLRKLIKDEMLKIKEKFANPRRTAIIADEGEFDIEDLIADDDVVITITRSGYIKRVRSSVYKTQGRGGRGVIGAKPKEGDIVQEMLSTTNHAFVLVFSNRGKVYRLKAHEVPEKDRTARGVSIRNLLPFTADESVAAVIDTRDFEAHKYLVIATRNGIIKKTAFTAYNSSRRDGIIALNLKKGDEVVMVRATSGEDELIMVSRKGMSICFKEGDVRPMGRTAGGVIGMRLGGGDDVVSFDVVDQNGELLIITDAGYGKRTLLERYPRQRRGGKGVKTAKLTGKRGSIQGAAVVRVGNEVFLIASDGQVIRMTAKDISRQGRDTTGVRVMRLDSGVTVAAMGLVTEAED